MPVAYDYCWFEPYLYEHMNENRGQLTVNFGISLTTA